MDIRETLTRPVGPLPLWGWILLGAAGLFLYERYKANQSSSSTSTSGLASLLGGNSTTASVGSSSDTASTDTSTDTSNEDWAQQAVQYLEGQGYSQSQAQGAISSYVNGGALDPSQATLVDSASQGVGQPPQLIIPTQSVPQMPSPNSGTGVASTTSSGSSTVSMPSSNTPTYVSQHQAAYGAAGATPATGGPKDTSGHVAYFKYTVKKGDTLSSIASKFGSGSKQLESWNKLSGNPKVGSTIWV